MDRLVVQRTSWRAMVPLVRVALEAIFVSLAGLGLRVEMCKSRQAGARLGLVAVCS